MSKNTFVQEMLKQMKEYLKNETRRLELLQGLPGTIS